MRSHDGPVTIDAGHRDVIWNGCSTKITIQNPFWTPLESKGEKQNIYFVNHSNNGEPFGRVDGAIISGKRLFCWHGLSAVEMTQKYVKC